MSSTRLALAAALGAALTLPAVPALANGGYVTYNSGYTTTYAPPVYSQPTYVQPTYVQPSYVQPHYDDRDLRKARKKYRKAQRKFERQERRYNRALRRAESHAYHQPAPIYSGPTYYTPPPVIVAPPVYSAPVYTAPSVGLGFNFVFD